MRRTFTDPATSDRLTLGEELSWQVQRIVRRWLVRRQRVRALVVEPGGVYMALLIESVVGIAMFSQTRRDATILRRVDRNEQTNAVILAHLEALLDHHGVERP